MLWASSYRASPSPTVFLFIYHITLSVKNELFHLCAEAAETGDVGPLLEDVITMIKEDVLDFVDFDNLFTAEGCATGRRHRALREAGIHRATTSHAIFKRTAGDHRGRRALRKTHPSACSPRARRARHLPYNHFTRPPRRRRLQTECPSIELLDGISIIGGYDGIQIFLKLELDVSKEDIEDLREVILKPLKLLSEAEFLRELNLFEDGDSLADSIFDNIEADISFSAGAHMGATGKEKQKCSLYWNFNRTDSLMLLQHDLL